MRLRSVVDEGRVGAKRHAALSTPVPARGYVLRPDEGVPGRDAEVKCSLQSTGGSVALYRSVVDGHGPPPHQHTHEDETIIVLDGGLEAECGADTFIAMAGSTVFLPRGLTHTFRSVDGPATILFIVTPGHLDEFFRLKDKGSDPADVARLAQEFF